MTGTSFIAGLRNKRDLGRQSGFPLLKTAAGTESGSCQEHFVVHTGCCYSHHLPAVEGRFLGQREKGGELVLGLL